MVSFMAFSGATPSSWGTRPRYRPVTPSCRTTYVKFFHSSRREIILQEANPMSGVFQNIDPPPPHCPASVCTPPPFGAGGGHTRWVERGVGVNILEDARHSSVLYICKYFVIHPIHSSFGRHSFVIDSSFIYHSVIHRSFIVLISYIHRHLLFINRYFTLVHLSSHS
jgi:hypothetical protein